ncbi:MAG: fatty acid desaturase [Lentisphaerae bacterium]|nr:fatty acid desaturase [Lentisphaerota bacterium]
MVSRYQVSSVARSTCQLVSTLIPYLALLGLMYWSLRWSYLITLLLAIPAAGFAVRLFVLSHDCGHHSFFKSKRWNDLWGSVCAFVVLTPYAYWRNEHARHHATSGNLDRRGVGDIWTLTVSEYLAEPRLVRLVYRLYRNPLVLFCVGPLYLFVIKYRFWAKWAGKADRRSVLLTNLSLVVVLLAIHYTIGLKALLMIQLPVLALASSAGVWLFYVQHQFEDVYWEKTAGWNFFRQAIQGASCYKLPRVLQWFSASIGYHHIHHLNPRIPNYRLEKCHRENDVFQFANVITLWTSLKSLRFRLWDEHSRRMVSLRGLRARVANAVQKVAQPLPCNLTR